jgi:hypothetical protein
MKRVAVARQGADGEAGIRDHLPILARAALVGQQRVEVHVIAPGPAARANLDRLHLLQRLHFREHVLHGQLAEHRCEDAKFHLLTSNAKAVLRQARDER